MIKKWIVSLAIIVSAGGALFVVVTPQTVVAATPVVDACNRGFLWFPAWYRGITDASCNIMVPTGSTELSTFIWHIVLNVIEIGLLASGYIAVAFILYGGIQYILTQGAVEGAVKARSMILNAIIGLVISIISVGIVEFVIEGVLQ